MNKIRKTEQDFYELHRKYNNRTLLLGTDPLGNRYWRFQQKSKDFLTWGSWLVCEKSPHLSHPSGKKDAEVVLDSKVLMGTNKNQSIYYLSGRDSIKTFIAWVKSHGKYAGTTKLIREMEEYLKFLD